MSQKGKWTGRLPDGQVTASTRRYVREWRLFAKPLAEALGGDLCAFDPNVRIIVDGRIVIFEGWIVEKLNKALATGRSTS